jgi:hypothetical protein
MVMPPLLLNLQVRQELTWTGPIFDAHDVRVLLIPGSIGMVLSLVFLSLSTGKQILSGQRSELGS